MKLIGSALSPYAVRVMIAARFKAIELPVQAPVGGTRSADHLAINPIGKVPVLIDGDLVLPESDLIVAYLEDRVQQPTLFPGDAAQRSNVRLVSRLMDNYGAPSFGPFLANDQAAVAIALERIDQALGYIDHFRREGAYASGDAFSAADCALIPFFHAFSGLQDVRPGAQTAASRGVVGARPRLGARRVCNQRDRPCAGRVSGRRPALS